MWVVVIAVIGKLWNDYDSEITTEIISAVRPKKADKLFENDNNEEQ